MLEQALNYVEDVIGGQGSPQDHDAAEGKEFAGYNCKIQPYSPMTFAFSACLVQFTVHAYVIMYVLSLGGAKPRLGKINAACLMLAYGLFTGGSTISVSKDGLRISGVETVPEIPLSRITGLDVKQGWITNLLLIHYVNSAGKACKLTFWALDPQQLAQQIQAACAGAKGQS